MRRNKQLLLAAVVAAVVILAVPAMALASVWKDKNGTNVSKLIELTMSGTEVLETTVGNGMSGCVIHATLTTEGGSTGTITKFEIKKCNTSFGSFKTTTCELKTGEGKGLPWIVHVNATDLTVTNWRSKHTFTGVGCKEPELDKTIASETVTLAPNSVEVSEVNFDGKIQNEKLEQVYRTFGSLEVEGTNKGTYGIG